MKIKKGFNLREIAGENLVLMNSEIGLDTTKVISLNDTAAWLWQKLEGQEFNKEDAIDLILDNYDIDRLTATADVEKWLEVLTTNNICE